MQTTLSEYDNQINLTNCPGVCSLILVLAGHSLIGTPEGQLRKNNLHKIEIIFLSINKNMCFGCSKEPSRRDSSFEYPQHTFWLRNKKNNFQLRTRIW